MTFLATRDCACAASIALGQKRPVLCPCGNRYLTEAQLNPKPRKPLPRVSEKGAGKQKGKRGGLKRSQRRESAAEKRARLHFNEVVKSWPCWFRASRPCDYCNGPYGHVHGVDLCPVCGCWDKHVCSGPKDAHHLIPKDFIRQRCSDWSEPDLLLVLFNPFIGAPLCRKAHEAVESGRDRIYFEDLTPECLEYVGSLPDFMLLRLERECPKRPVERKAVAS